MKDIFRLRLKYNGSALIAVIIFLVVASILGAAILQVSLAETKTSVRDQKIIEAKYIAKAGVDTTISWIMSHQSEISNLYNKESSATAFGTGDFKVKVIGDATSSNIIVESNATVDGVTETVRRVLNMTQYTGVAFDYDFFSVNSLAVGGNTSFVGSVASNGSITISGHGSVSSGYLQNQTNTYPSVNFPVPGSTPVNGTINTNWDLSNGVTRFYDVLRLNGELTINTGSGAAPVIVVVNEIITTGRINLSGVAPLHIYVKNAATLDDFNAYKHGNSEYYGNTLKLAFLLGDGSAMVFTNGNTYFSGLIYGPKATVGTTGTVNIKGAVNVGGINSNGTVVFTEDAANGTAIGNITFPVNIMTKGSYID